MAVKKRKTPGNDVLAFEAPVEIAAGESKDGQQTQPTFKVTAYTGGPMELAGFNLPVVVDLAGMRFSNSLVANLDHDGSKRVGHVTGKTKLKEMGGVVVLAPLSAGLFLVAALSLAGMPPFSGFLAKLVVIRAALAGHQFAVVTVAMVTSFLTLLSMVKIWTYVFWGKPRRGTAIAGWRASRQ